jgi:predicted RNase H-like nuclease (RuvC/YqgF family)
LKENNDMLMAKIERSALQEEQYRQLKKKVEDWGGEGYIASSMSKIKTLKLENESKDTKIKELNDRLSTLNENKGAELLSALNSAGEDSDGKTKGALMLEVSQKSNEILELKEKLNQALESLKMTKQGNPFDRAGGSDDEDNKERIVTRNSIDNRVNI